MVRTPATNYSSPGYSYATADTDAFDRTDVSGLGQSVDGHDHSSGKGLPLAAGAIPAGSITSAMIADGTIVAGDIADGAITSAKILDGTIATVDHADASVTNAKLASDTARANLLTNGGFEIWQRGNGPFTTNGVYTADRWQLFTSGTDTLSVAIDGGNVDTSSGSCRAAACTFANNGGGNTVLFQTLKTGAEFNAVRRTLSASIRVRSSTTGAVKLQVRGDGTGWVNVDGTTYAGGNTWQTLSVAGFSAPSDATKIEIHVVFLASCTIYIDNAMLVVGSVPADYAPLHPADDMARCLRYYEIARASAEFVATAVNQTVSTPVQFKAMKPVTPTLTTGATLSTGNSTIAAVGNVDTGGAYFQIKSSAAGPSFDVGRVVYIEANP